MSSQNKITKEGTTKSPTTPPSITPTTNEESTDLEETPSVIALSNLRCPSPPPILRHPAPVSSRQQEQLRRVAASGSGEVDKSTENEITHSENQEGHSTESPHGLTGLALRRRVAVHAMSAAMAAQTARVKKQDPVKVDTQSKLTEALNLPDPSHNRAPSIHAHFFVDDTLKHGPTRSRSTSVSSDGRSIVDSMLQSAGQEPLQQGRLRPGARSPYSALSSASSGEHIPSPSTAGARTPSGIQTPCAGLRTPSGARTPSVDARLPENDGKLHVLFGACGSISISKTRLIIHKLQEIYRDKVSIQLILTRSAEHFVSRGEFPSNIVIWKNSDEWNTWHSRTDPVIHIELRRWANILIVAPLSANTLSKIAIGLCDNLLTNVIRAWNTQYPILLAPAMVSFAYNSSVTKKHFKTIAEEMKWIQVLKPTEKVVSSYGEIGMGGMMDWNEIVDRIVRKLGGYPEEDDDDDDDDDSSYTYESEIVDYNLDKEWQDIVTQCNSLVFLVLIPVVGRMIGRRFAHYIWHRVADRIF